MSGECNVCPFDELLGEEHKVLLVVCFTAAAGIFSPEKGNILEGIHTALHQWRGMTPEDIASVKARIAETSIEETIVHLVNYALAIIRERAVEADATAPAVAQALRAQVGLVH